MILIDLRGMRRRIAAVFIILLIAGCIFAIFAALGTINSINPDDMQYKEYAGYEGRFKYKLPAGWKTTEQKFEGNEILYHNDFIANDSKTLGFVQLWKLNMSIKDFLEESKKSAVDAVNFEEYAVEPVKINGREGYILQYIREVDGGKFVKAFEVFIPDGGNIFHRFAFYMNEKAWKESMKIKFLNIAAAAELK